MSSEIENILLIFHSNSDSDIIFAVNCIVPHLTNEQLNELEAEMRKNGWRETKYHPKTPPGLWERNNDAVRTRNLKEYCEQFGHKSWG